MEPATPAPAPAARAVAELAELVGAGGALVLSGAGMSTDSGIPDYRGPGSENRRSGPISYQEFTRQAEVRRRYWARSFVGWPQMASREPNAGHRAIAALEAAGLTTGLITQNVDGLHQAAGSLAVIELHGSLALVRCLACGEYEARNWLQRRLAALNPGFADQAFPLLPDGDADIPDALIAGFVVPSCLACGGMLKPDVVYFGENVPAARVARCFALLEAARSLLVVGSSLSVMSGYRFVTAAVRAGKPVAIVNDGPTRGDGDAAVKVEGRLGTVLPVVVRSAVAAEGMSPASRGFS